MARTKKGAASRNVHLYCLLFFYYAFSGHLLVLGLTKSLGRRSRGWISQYIPCCGGVRIQCRQNSLRCIETKKNIKLIQYSPSGNIGLFAGKVKMLNSLLEGDFILQ